MSVLQGRITRNFSDFSQRLLFGVVLFADSVLLIIHL